MALNPPGNVVATTISSLRIDLTWVNPEEGGNYQYIEVWENKDGEEDYLLKEEISGRLEYYEADNLDEDTRYCYYLVGGTYEPDEESGYSNPDCATTYIFLQSPTDIVVTAISGTQLEIVFKDNSENESSFTLQRKADAGEWETIKILEPNRDFYRDSEGLSTGVDYLYQVAASPPNWCTLGAAVQTIAAPDAPSSLAIAKTDETMRLSWTAGTGNITGYKIEKSTNGADYSEIAVIGNLLEFLVKGLDPNTQYWFRVRAYGAGGNSGYSNTPDDTTDSQYQFSEYEKWIRNPKIKPVYLAEIDTKMTLSGFALDSGVTYKLTVEERGIDIYAVYEDGTAYTEKTSIATVEANASSFWFDYDNRILYVHTSAGTAPSNFFMEGAFWLYFATKDMEFNGNKYLGFMSKDDIPDITQEIKPYFEGNFRISSGSISFKNDDLTSKKYFDKRYEDYTWIGSKVILKAGREDFTFSQFKEIFTGRIDSQPCNDKKITFQLRDVRQGMEKKLVLDKYNTDDYPDIEEDFIGEPIPVGFGFKDKVIPICVDWHNKKFNYHDGRSKSVTNVYKNNDYNNPLTKDIGSGGDYYVDLQRSIITFDRDGCEINEEDIIEVSFIGAVNSADEPIENHAEVFKYIMNTYRGLADSELDHDSIYESKYANEDEISVFLYEDTPYDEIVKNIEHSRKSYTFQDTQGRLGLKPQISVTPSNVKYIRNHHIFDHLQNKDKKSLFWKVNVYYGENPQNQDWLKKTATNNEVYWKYGTTKELDIYTYFYSPSYAQNLANDILALLNKQVITDTLPFLLFDELPGNLIKYSRNRFYSSSGVADEITMRIIKISKSPASGKTFVDMEPV